MHANRKTWTPAEQRAFHRRRRASAGHEAARRVVVALHELIASVDDFLDCHGEGCPCAFCHEVAPLSDAPPGQFLADDFASLVFAAANVLNFADNEVGSLGTPAAAR
jgi:hypothetical protein